MPVRFTTPRLGGIFAGPQLQRHHWQIDFAYRHLGADEWFVGTQVNEAAAPFGHPLFLNIHSFDVTANYGLTDRLTLALNLPFSYGTHNRFYADGKRHQVSAKGLGDVSVVASAWLFDAKAHPAGNVSIGVGVKPPTGDNASADDFFLANGTVVQRPVDQAIQLGDGGWGIITQANAYRELFRRMTAFGSVWYLISPREMTNVASPLPGLTLSVPDVFDVRLGGAYAAMPRRGVSLNVGTRIDGIPKHDLYGGDRGFRRPGYTLYVEPGASIEHGRTTFAVNVPIRAHQNFRRSIADEQLGTPGGGDLARVLVLAGYSIRF